MNQDDQDPRPGQANQYRHHRQNSQHGKSRPRAPNRSQRGAAVEGGGEVEGDVGPANVQSWYHIGAAGDLLPCRALEVLVRLGLGLAQLLPSLFPVNPFLYLTRNVFEASGHMSAPMPPDVSRGAMPAMHTYGSDPDLLLREEYVHKAVH
ncbi:hypothetical protein VTH82DRAFT_3847 [Thermothelomyces myriococcoides]